MADKLIPVILGRDPRTPSGTGSRFSAVGDPRVKPEDDEYLTPEGDGMGIAP